MLKVTYADWMGVPAGKSVWDGFNGDKIAPEKPGTYTLYEKVNDDNTHAGWEWVRDEDQDTQ